MVIRAVSGKREIIIESIPTNAQYVLILSIKLRKCTEKHISQGDNKFELFNILGY